MMSKKMGVSPVSSCPPQTTKSGRQFRKGSSRDSITFQNRLILRPDVAIAGQQTKEFAAAADSG